LKVNFTKKEYLKLLDLVYLGDMVLDGALDGNLAPEYIAMREKIFALAKEYGYEDLIEYDKELDMHFETAKYEASGVMDYLDSYVNSSHIDS